MKKTYKKLILGGGILFMIFGFISCESYLDKQADSSISEKEAFKNFTNFQGFIEEIYNCVPDKMKNGWTTSWNWGDDEVFNLSGNSHMTNQVDLGNFWAWQNATGNWLDKSSVDATSTDRMKHALWPHAWYCVRKANLGLANLDKLTEATQEEKDLIEGQLYFFRAWWQFELMQYLGGLPYIDRVFPVDEKLTLPRLSYQECADKAGADFRKAADLLPINWDDTKVGGNYKGKNQIRLTKIMALGYLGKNYLWAGSPLMKNGAQTGGTKTYDYDVTYCNKAAEAFGELLALVEAGQTQYGLADFKYKDIYNHIKADDATTRFSDVFYTTGQNGLFPGSVEALFRGAVTSWEGSAWNLSKTFGPKIKGLVEHDIIIHQPTANYVNYYGMANGLPLDDPDSGFDKTYPFKNRDPRFYHDIVFDGFKYVNAAMPSNMESLRYCTLHTGGEMRSDELASRTGYFIQKLAPHTCNKFDGAYNWGPNMHIYLPYMRLGDVYLMYAEACAAVGGASSKSSNFTKTAEDAINTIRKRVDAGSVNKKYTAVKTKFIDEIRRERAVELAFEGFRFNDLQRWLLLTEAPYNIKTSQEFDRVENANYFKTNDPRNAQVANFREKVIVTRLFGTKHYWLPLKTRDVSMYPEFGQNPGW